MSFDRHPADPAPPGGVTLVVNGAEVVVTDSQGSLLSVLREQLGLVSVKDGCSPQGQCGCCTVLVDGAPRVACVTPVRRVTGRTVTTVEGLPMDRREAWGAAFCATGGSQCGFCTPGIILRLEGALAKLAAKGGDTALDRGAVDQALAAHLCRCTGWHTIEEACAAYVEAPASMPTRDLDAAARRATIEGGAPQRVGPEVALGQGGFADDTAPPDSLVAVPDAAGGWAVGPTVAEARAASGKVQGRRSTVDAMPPIDVPEGDWALVLQTSWVEPAYLETDASWCAPGGEPASPLANGGAFGGKVDSIVRAAARDLAAEHGRPVRVVLSREDAVRMGAKRPPVAIAVGADGHGVVRVARTAGIADVIAAAAPAWQVDEVDLAGPSTSAAIRGAGWVECMVARAACDLGRRNDDGRSLEAPVTVTSPAGGRATVSIADEGLSVEVAAGVVLDEVVLRSYCVGAAHMALSWVTSEGLAVDAAGIIHDLTIRSFGIVRAADMPPVRVHIDGHDGRDPVNASDAVFAAVAAAVWLHQGCPAAWPTRRPLLGS